MAMLRQGIIRGVSLMGVEERVAHSNLGELRQALHDTPKKRSALVAMAGNVALRQDKNWTMSTNIPGEEISAACSGQHEPQWGRVQCPRDIKNLYASLRITVLQKAVWDMRARGQALPALPGTSGRPASCVDIWSIHSIVTFSFRYQFLLILLQ